MSDVGNMYLFSVSVSSHVRICIIGHLQRSTAGDQLKHSLQRQREGAELPSDSCVCLGHRGVWFAFFSASSSPQPGEASMTVKPALPPQAELRCKSRLGSFNPDWGFHAEIFLAFCDS